MASLTVPRFLERLGKGKPEPGFLLLGGDLYLRDICRAKLIEAFVPEAARDWGVSRFSAADDSLDRILAQAQSMPMLASAQVIFVAEVEALQRLGDDSREEIVARLKAYFADPAPFTVLVFEAAALDARMAILKTLSASVEVVRVELGGEGEERIAAGALLAEEMARKLDVALDREAAAELVESCDAGMARVETELRKIATYVGERRKIAVADVETLVVAAKKYSVWQLADMLAARDRARALEFLDSLLREGEQPAGLVGAMAWMYRKLIEALELSPHTAGWQAARQLGMRGEAAELALRQARRIPRPQLLAGLSALSEADSRLKSGAPNPRAVMEFLVAELTAPPATERAIPAPK